MLSLRKAWRRWWATVGADVHAGGDLVVVQSLGDEAGDDLLGIGQALPPGDRPGRRRAPVAAADAEPAQSPPDAGLVAVGANLAASAECLLQVVDRLILAALLPSRTPRSSEARP